MEIFELRYFLGVANDENIHRASEKLNVSPGSLSKAITRLEDELLVRLFHREGRHIRLTEQGRLLQRRASEIIQLEESAKIEVGGHKGVLKVILAGPEVLLSKMGIELCKSLKKKYPAAVFEFVACNDNQALEKVQRGEAHLALVTSDVPKDELTVKILEETKFRTYVGAGHPLFAAAKAKKTVPVTEVLEHSFVSPSQALLGKVGLKQSLDGWRDDQFPRKLDYLTSSLKLLEELLLQGRALAYLPEYFCDESNALILKITGCPYTCVQKVKLVSRRPKDIGWLNDLF